MCAIDRLHDAVRAGLIVLSCLLPCAAIAQEKALRYFDQIAYGGTLAGRSDAEKKELDKLSEALSLLNEYSRNAKLQDYSLIGSVGFSTFTNVANGDARSNIQVSLDGDLKAGTYPTQHKIKGGIQLRNNDGVVFEDISTLHVALDHHPLHRAEKECFKNLAPNVEIFGFIDRSANSYMGVVRRYQGGAGFILSAMFGEQKKPVEGRPQSTWNKRSELLNAVQFDKIVTDAGEPYRSIRAERARQDPGSDKKLKEYAEALHELSSTTRHYLRKRYSECRLSLLMGALLEDDIIEFADSLSRLDLSSAQAPVPDSLLKVEFINPAKLRFSFRVKYEWKCNQGFELATAVWGFFWFNPKPWRTAQGRDELSTNEDPRQAWRLQIPVEIKYNPDDFVSISVEYNYMKEYSPLRRWVPIDGTGVHALFEAPDEFWNLLMKVNVRIK